jgi:DNA-binding transcriptional MerR regulator
MLHRFSIQEISTLTGIKAHTLRIWEQRYNILKPKRTSTNIRFYDDDDLKLLLNISVLNNEGHRISQIAKLTDEEINARVVEYASHSNDLTVHLQALTSATLNLDEASFERILFTSIQQIGMERTMSEVIFPFMKKIGQMWMSGSIQPAYEHFISNLIRQKLIVAIDGQVRISQKNPRKFLIFLPEGETHELGLLFANYMIRSRGHIAVYLGQSTPLVDLEKVSIKFQPDFLFMTLTAGRLRKPLNEYISALIAKFPVAKLILTGQYAISQKENLPEDTLLIESTEQFVKFLES